LEKYRKLEGIITIQVYISFIYTLSEYELYEKTDNRNFYLDSDFLGNVGTLSSEFFKLLLVDRVNERRCRVVRCILNQRKY